MRRSFSIGSIWMSVARSLYASPMIWFTNLTHLASCFEVVLRDHLDLVDIEHVLLQQLVERLRADAIVTLQGLRNVRLSAKGELDAALRDEPDRFQHRQVEWII